MTAHRLVEPEILDVLSPDDPRARASRRDLKRINAFMLQSRIMARALCALPPPRTLVDLGSGDGQFLLAVARRMARRWRGVTVSLVDQQNIVTEDTRAGFKALGWACETVPADVFDYLARMKEADIVTANLFLHHFPAPALQRLLANVAGAARGFVACEPRRSPLAILGSKLVFVLGANDVSRHDAVASVRAGFAGNELSALWPATGWSCRETWAPPFTHLFVAHRDSHASTGSA